MFLLGRIGPSPRPACGDDLGRCPDRPRHHPEGRASFGRKSYHDRRGSSAWQDRCCSFAVPAMRGAHAQVHRSSPQVRETRRRYCRTRRDGPQSVRNNDTPGSGKWEGVIMAVAEAPGYCRLASARTRSLSPSPPAASSASSRQPRCRVCRKATRPEQEGQRHARPRGQLRLHPAHPRGRQRPARQARSGDRR